jgi:hypothetical protein
MNIDCAVASIDMLSELESLIPTLERSTPVRNRFEEYPISNTTWLFTDTT